MFLIPAVSAWYNSVVHVNTENRNFKNVFLKCLNSFSFFTPKELVYMVTIYGKRPTEWMSLRLNHIGLFRNIYLKVYNEYDVFKKRHGTH